jgi:alpha-L-fucosidase
MVRLNMSEQSTSRRVFLKASAAAAGAVLARDLAAAEPAVGPTAAQKAWMRLGYGMFIHFGPNTILGVGWGDGKFPPARVVFPKLSTRQWAEVAAEAGMKYAVLTTKHHDGFCLWPSKYTDYCIKNSPQHRDIVGEFVTDFRKAGIKPGFYYSTWDRHHPQYENDAAYAQYMRDQVKELLTTYGAAVEWCFDGSWDKDHPTRRWEFDPAWEKDPQSGLKHGERYEWKALYELIHQLQPDSIVLHNSSSDRPGGIRYFPVDARTAEHFDFVYHGKVVELRRDPVFEKPGGGKVYLPLECQATLTPAWFWSKSDFLVHTSAATIADWYRRARAADGNLLLNLGPDADGLVPEYHRPFLKAAAKELSR